MEMIDVVGPGYVDMVLTVTLNMQTCLSISPSDYPTQVKVQFDADKLSAAGLTVWRLQ